MMALKPLGFAVKIHGGPYQAAGLPDILFWRSGVSYAFEVKRPGEAWGLQELQRVTLDRLSEEGVCVSVVHSVNEVLQLITGIEEAPAHKPKTQVHLDFDKESVKILTEDISEFLKPDRGGQ